MEVMRNGYTVLTSITIKLVQFSFIFRVSKLFWFGYILLSVVQVGRL